MALACATAGLAHDSLWHWPVQLQAWLIHLEDATQDVDTGSKKQRRRSRVKVHRGFHTSWRLNGMREKVADLIRSEVCPDDAAAQRMKVLFTGEGWLCFWQHPAGLPHQLAPGNHNTNEGG